MWDRLNVKQRNQIWKHRMTALVREMQHIFSISAIINSLLDTAHFPCLTSSAISYSVVLDSLPCSVSLIFCFVSSAGISRLWQPFQNHLYQYVRFYFWWHTCTLLLHLWIFSYVISHYCPIHCYSSLNIDIIWLIIHSLFCGTT